MKVYELLQALEAEGRLNGMFRCGLLQPHLKKWMTLEALHRGFPELSYDELSRYVKHASKGVVHNAIVFMNQDVT